MPQRASTRRGYEVFIRNYVLPAWRDARITDLQARPVELWLHPLSLAPRSKVHIRGILRALWDYAMWRGDVPLQRNPMELVQVRNASKRMGKPRTVTIEEFQRFPPFSRSRIGRWQPSLFVLACDGQNSWG